ncbi:P-loop containing nucleoside triphosphate hydrolase protein [Pisolithus orientalis]|uniref:P-loop containing nucleoside triphosphate hydrolase protein n=1 Tax=Pisolithus orientalis TaxID=936130 RepID=UPI002224E609|nr:P-loop containing nucleoside triphosphate hydrolase protein [Pisolithus orientalis]KAI6003466.1 P-loop containing nucleoside triphosphate hydrolase protein [Pisolithus orientalis]
MSDTNVQSFWSAIIPGLLSNLARSHHNQEGVIQPRWFFRRWRLLLLIFIALLQVFAWIALGIYHLVTDKDDFRTTSFSIVIGTMWLYNLLKPVLSPRRTAYIDLFVLYTILLGFGVIRIGISIYHFGAAPLTILEWIGMSLNLMAITAGLGVICTMPLTNPPDDLRREIYVRRSPEDYASIFEWATYSWVYPLIKIGNTREMKPEDVWDLTPAMQSESIFKEFSTTRAETLCRRLWAPNFSDLCLDILLTIVTVLLSYAAPYFLYQILNLIENPTRESRSKAYALALVAFVCAVLKARRGEADAQHLFFGRRASVRVSTQLTNAIYDKALKQSGVTMQEPASETGPAVASPNSNHPKRGAGGGKIVSLAAIDANKVSAIIASAYLLYGGPLETILACIGLYMLLGSAAYAGLVVMLCAWALHICIAQRQARSRGELSASRDRRMSALYELINAVRFIKFFSLEDDWIKRVQRARSAEMDWLERFRMKSVLSTIVWTAAPVLVSVVSFFVYVDRGYQLTPSVAFTTIALMSMLRQPLNVFPNFLVQVLEARLSLERIEAFLNEEELSDLPSGCPEETDDTIAVKKGRFKWKKVSNENIHLSQEQNTVQLTLPTGRNEATPSVCPGKNALTDGNRFELRDINVCFPKGELSLVTGPTGCGKTALLLALLGQLAMVKGTLVKPGGMFNALSTAEPLRTSYLAAISYAAQIPWLHSGTVKENILFGSQYDEGRYDNVVERCALRSDLNQLPEGDQTQVGDRGVNLSGGQKARIALARAVYAQTQYVLLDDPFSAIDTQTLRYLYERLFCGPLLAGRTVVLVTHYVGLVLPKANYIVCMQNGQIITKGPVKDLREEGRLPPILQNLTGESQDVQIHQLVTGDGSRQQIPDESPGGVAFSPYKTYGQTSPRWMWIAFVCLVVMSQCMGVAEKLWIREWEKAYGNNQAGSLVWYELSRNAFLDSVSNTYQQTLALLPDASDRPLLYVALYALIAFIMAVSSVVSTIVLYTATRKASCSLFSRLLEDIVHASLPWHDTTPRGQILDRFSKDMQAIDVTLSNDVATVAGASVNFIAAVFTVLAFFPAFVIPAAFFAFCYHFVGTQYLTVNRKLLRMESTSRSLIFSAFGELLDGIVTIQALRSAHRFMEDFHRKVDVANKMHYNSWITNRWLLFNCDVLGACAVLATTLLALSEHVDAGTAGLCMTSAMLFSMSMYLVCRFGASLGLELNAVVRVAECLSTIEDPQAISQHGGFPDHLSNLSVEKLCAKYPSRPEPVLKNVSFTLNVPERIAIVGRTGSGRSTLVNSILRFINLSGGRVVIGGIDFSTIDARTLRLHITYIPEDATLFSGTLRENVDPLHKHEDDDCLNALRSVRLLRDNDHAWRSSNESRCGENDTNSRAPITLDTQVVPGGANFSLGERQLIAMARALLRRDSIVILDEATSSVDFETDAAIQETLRKEFKTSLVINVAHRLSTIVDYDRVIVLKDGQVAEFDTPLKLIKKDGGVFKNMCLDSESYADIRAAILGKVKKDRQKEQS